MLRALVFAVALLAASAAWSADDAGGYIGASLGVSSAPRICQQDVVRWCEGNSAALRGFVGYAFNHHFAVEAGLSALSSATAITALDLSAIGAVPLAERVALYGRLGAF